MHTGENRGRAKPDLADEVRRLERQIENLEVALRTSRTIGVAMGILMASQKITRDAAFALLSDASQRSNRKLVRIAEHVEASGEITSPFAD